MRLIPDAVIDSAHHPDARRVTDVLRGPAGAGRTFLIDDEENIVQAVRGGIRLDGLYLTDDAPPAHEMMRAAQGTPVHVISARVGKELFGVEKRSRVFALARTPRPPALADVTHRPGPIVVLDGVRLAGNIGAIIRTACALDAAGVVLVDSGLTSALDRRLIRASRGHVFSLPVVLAGRRAVRGYLQEQGVGIATLTARASTPLSAIGELPDRIGLLLGSERAGASDDLDSLATHRYFIPMSAEVESLNVSVAAAIALYAHREASTRRRRLVG
jgi:TrmH family RNA methyltransferase